VMLSGIEFTATVQGDNFHYLFTDTGWYESKDNQNWEKRHDMGDTLWTGLYYLKSYDAKIYYKDKEIKDVTEFARGADEN